MQLPVNERMFSEIKNFESSGSANWHSLLDGKNTFQLLYSLQIIDGLLATESPNEVSFLVIF